MHYSEITQFWFDEIKPKKWFEKDEEFDSLLSDRFLKQVELGLKGKLNIWNENIGGCLGLILLMDQFTRNIFRDTPKAFEGDSLALDLSLDAIKKGYLTEKNSSWRHFLLMPLMHSENLAIQEMSLPLFQHYTNEKTYTFAKRHHDIIRRFSRFPHRNQLLGRVSSIEEDMFLAEPGSSF